MNLRALVRAQDCKSGNKYRAPGLSPLTGLGTVSCHVSGGYHHRLISGRASGAKSCVETNGLPPPAEIRSASAVKNKDFAIY
jgi:hypothetical protein